MATTQTLWSLLLAALVLAPLAGAQQGPVPGSDPASYAQDHLVREAANATADPAGHARQEATPEGLGEEARTAAFVACWAAHEVAGMAADLACAPFFTPPERAPRPARAANGTGDADGALNATATGAAALANATLGALNGTLADPGSAPSQLRRIVDAAAAFANATASLVVRIAKGAAGCVVDVVLGAAHAILHGLGLAGHGAGIAAGAIGDAVHALAAAVAGAAKAVAAGAGAVLQGLVDGISSAADGMAAAGKAVGEAAVGAAQAAGHAVSSAFDAIANLLGGSGGKEAPAPSGRGLGKALPAADGLLGTARDALPL